MQRNPDSQLLVRGLKVLEAVNARPGAITAEICQRCNLSRTSTHRILMTLARNGFVYRDASSGGFYAAHGVLNLARGYDGATQLAEIARDELAATAATVLWPLSLSIPEDIAMRVASSTDHFSPFAVERLVPGERIPMLQCSAGLAWLSTLTPSEREPLVDAALGQPAVDKRQTRWSRGQLEATLAETSRAGFAVFRRPQRLTNMIGLAVPVRSGERPTAALTVRFAESALPVREGVTRFLATLQEVALRLGEAFRLQSAERA
jgi:DNA-binding IclR family transcriptional regulator